MILVACHTHIQLDLFLSNNGILRNQVQRVVHEKDVRGYIPEGTKFYRLEGWEQSRPPLFDAMRLWKYRGGTFIDVPEGVVLGRAKLKES